MKKKVVFALISLLLGFPLYSQQAFSLDSLPPPSKPFTPEWAFGASGGVTLSNIGFNPTVKQESLLQYTGGLTARYISEKNVGLQLELNYSMRGWKEKTDSVDMYKKISPNILVSDSIWYTNYSRSLAYLEIPVMTHIYFNMGKRMRIIFLLGPQISFLLSEKVIEKEVVTNLFGIPPYYNQKIQKSFDYGLMGGMGFEFRTGIITL